MKSSCALALALALALFAGCSSSSTVEHATLGDLGFFVPSGWTSRSLSNPQHEAVECTPLDNEGKQSVTVWRTAPREWFSTAELSAIATLLVEAQHGLSRASFSAPRMFTTEHGFRGVRVEGEFVPPGQQRPYRRIHAVVLDGSSLIHVVHTAARGDADAFEVVLGSLYRGGAS